MADMNMQRFKHTRLDPTASEIRLLQIQTSVDPTRPIEIVMKHVTLNQDTTDGHKDDSFHRPAYIALSYTWGPETPTQNIFVTCNNNQGYIPVRLNLYEFMKIQAQPDDATHANEPRWYWIDQLCIDQGNETEKGHQVNQMAEIFTRATTVEVWLGVAFEGSDEFMNAIEHAASYETLELYISAADTSLEELRERYSSAGRRVIGLPYWSRLWVIQEMLLGKAHLIRLGHRTLLWNYFGKGVLHLSWHLGWTLESRKIRELFFVTDSLIHSFNWHFISLIVYNTRCFDVRDKAFGVLGLVHESLRFYPDYSLTTQDVLLRIVSADVEANQKYPGSFKFRRTANTVRSWFLVLDQDSLPIDPRAVRHDILGIFRTRCSLRRRLWFYNIYLWIAIPNEDNLPWRVVKHSTECYDSLHVRLQPSLEPSKINRKIFDIWKRTQLFWIPLELA